jgi:hypothetical protein
VLGATYIVLALRGVLGLVLSGGKVPGTLSLIVIFGIIGIALAAITPSKSFGNVKYKTKKQRNQNQN